VIRFGGSGGPEAKWIEAGSFWEGQNTTGAAGTLLLNVNDNDPHNGDPNKRWDVRIRVKRRGAAAAGLFV
jgi:hypothetical protein